MRRRYPYAAGKPKFSQAANGVQTCYEYGATSEHGAVHKHTSTTKADGELVAGQSRKSEEFIAADGTVTFEQESVWDGTDWLPLSSDVYEYDEQRRVVKQTDALGRITTTSYSAGSCMLMTSTARMRARRSSWRTVPSWARRSRTASGRQ